MSIFSEIIWQMAPECRGRNLFSTNSPGALQLRTVVDVIPHSLARGLGEVDNAPCSAGLRPKMDGPRQSHPAKYKIDIPEYKRIFVLEEQLHMFCCKQKTNKCV